MEKVAWKMMRKLEIYIQNFFNELFMRAENKKKD